MMRLILALIIVFVARTLALAVPDVGVIDAVVSSSPSEVITFKASNGSNVLLNIAAGVRLTDDIHSLPWPITKHIKVVKGGEHVELCAVRVTQRDSGVGSPHRDDCQALFDYVRTNPALIYFEHPDSDLNRWAEIVWVGSCAFRARTYTRDVVISTGDIANFLDRSLSRPAWTIDGRISAAGEADCAVWSSPSGNAAPSFWRLQQRGPLTDSTPNNGTIPGNFTSSNEVAQPVNIRRAKSEKPLIVESFAQIPHNASAYVFNGTFHEIPEEFKPLNSTVSKRYEMYLGGDPEGPFCTPVWLSSDWHEANTPLKSDCRQLLGFCKQNTAKVVFKERDLNFWAKFAAHESCGLSFMTSKEKVVITNRDMAGFLERAINYEPSTYMEIGVRAKMGVHCGYRNEKQYQGEFRLFYRDPSLPKGDIEQRAPKGNDLLDASHEEDPDFKAPSDEDSFVVS
ncbi:hypothetical protein CTA2_3652 [Colletotrichum tanaceti]|uniref:Ecp2 effector protein-like domain-containing protein n=1 Tax=Colletotrichum tanaceti TaxID=1306861 RepID=A0A4U6XT64_9PEZI|nr:hypothetical protein CTA2_3652 [Colletotrichum tanaceti]TKW59153.1 hypothetical protein CTA1_902 [Colletotrichum tanaceti]